MPDATDALLITARRPDCLPAVPFFAGLDRAAVVLLADHLPHRRRTPVTRIPIPPRPFSMPVLGGSRHSIAELCLAPGARWRRKLLAALDHACAGSTYHAAMRDDLAATIDRAQAPAALNRDLLALMLRALGIGARVERVSDWSTPRGGTAETAGETGSMLAEAAAALGAGRLELPPDAIPPAGLPTRCAELSLPLGRSAPAPVLPERWRDTSIYLAVALWGRHAGRHLGIVPSSQSFQSGDEKS